MRPAPPDPARRATVAPAVVAVVGYGFIGRRVARAAASAGHEVRVLTRTPPASSGKVDCLVVGDAADVDVVAPFIEGVDHLVWSAGTARPAESDREPLRDLERNLAPLLATLDAAAAARLPHFTFLSSGGTVYGPDAPNPVAETAPTWPLGAYGAIKVASECFVGTYAQQHGRSADVLRCSNVYGPGQPTDGSQGIVGIFERALRADEPITVFGDGNAARDFIHVDDVADVALRLRATADGFRVLNLGSGSETTVLELIELLGDRLGVMPRIERAPAREFDVPSVRLDTTRLRSILDFAPRTLADGLAAPEPVAQ